MKKVSFRIRKQYFDAIINGNKKYELRSHIPFWVNRLLCNNPPKIAVFVCGKRVHRRKIIDIGVGKPIYFLGRQLSEHGKQDIPTENCIAVKLGDALCGDCGEVLHMSDVFDAIGDPKGLRPLKLWICSSCGYSENR